MGTGLKALGEKQVNFSVDGSTDGVAGTQADPAVTALSNGDFVVVYENPQAGDNMICWRISSTRAEMRSVRRCRAGS